MKKIERGDLETFFIETPQKDIAASLEIENYQLNLQDAQSARKALLLIYECVHSWPALEGQALAEHLIENETKINTIFDACSVAWRFPVYIDRDLHGFFMHDVDNGKIIFKNIMRAWQWYAFFQGKKAELGFYKTASIYDRVPSMQAKNFIEVMTTGVWGSMQKKWIEGLGLSSQSEKYERATLEAANEFVDKSFDGGKQFREEVITALKSQDLAFEVLFIYANCFGARPEHHIDALNFLLCQTQMVGYHDIVTHTTDDSNESEDILPVWCHWIGKNFPHIIHSHSHQRALLDFAFSLDGSPIFKDGKVCVRHKRKKDAKKEQELVGLPPDVIVTLEKCYLDYKDTVINVRRNMRQATAKIIASTSASLGNADYSIPVSPASIGPISAETLETDEEKSLVDNTADDSSHAGENSPTPVDTGKEKSEEQKNEDSSQKVNILKKNEIFVKGKKGNNLEQLDLSTLKESNGNSIEGIIVELRRKGKTSKTWETLEVDAGAVNQIPPVLGEKNSGHFEYSLAITLPTGYAFSDGKNELTVVETIFTKAESTPEEIAAEKKRITEQTRKPLATVTEIKTVDEIKPTVSGGVNRVLESAEQQKTLEDTITAWELARDDSAYSSELHEDGTVSFQLGEELINELHDSGFTTLRIDSLGGMTPDIGMGEIGNWLRGIASNLREKKQAEIREDQEKQQEESEYQGLREHFQPLYDFIAQHTFVDKDKADLFKIASEKFHTSLRGMGWSMPWKLTKDGQIQFRNINNKVTLTYTSEGRPLRVMGEDKRILSKAEDRCYTEIAEAFSPLALFYTAEPRERKKMITREKKFHSDMKKGAEAYEVHLKNGKARLVQYSSDKKGSIWNAKFPSEERPLMLEEKANYETVESLLSQHEFSELCYRRDIFRINGEQSDKRSNPETIQQNIHDLRQSPRARYILRKRILITLGFEKRSGDDSRVPIKNEKGKHDKKSAFEILEDLKKRRNIQSREDIDNSFIDEYIDLLGVNEVPIFYIWPLSGTLEEHRSRVEKILKQKQKRVTAD